MKKTFISLIAALAIICFTGNIAVAQQQQPQQQQVNIKPIMLVDYLVFAANALQTIDIQGSEVDAFLLCQQTLGNEVQKCVDQKKLVTDQITFDIRLDVAQTIVAFLGRAKLLGSDAIKYKGFVNAFAEAAQKIGR